MIQLNNKMLNREIDKKGDCVMKYQIKLLFSDETSVLIDTVYDTRDEAEASFKKWFSIHINNLRPNDPDMSDYEIIEVDEK